MGGQKVRMQAFKTDFKWQSSYPKWTFPDQNNNQSGEDIVHHFTNNSPILNTFIVTGGLKYDLSVKGNFYDPGKKGVVVVYPSLKAVFKYDFGLIGKEVLDKIKSSPFLSTGLQEAITFPNGTLEFKNSWQEMDNSPKTIWQVEFKAGLDPLLGLKGKVQLIGPPAFITKLVGAEAGLFLVLDGGIKLMGKMKRDKSFPNGDGEVKLTVDINGGASLEGALPGDVIKASAKVTGNINGGALVKFNGTINALTWRPVIKSEGLKFKVTVELFDGTIKPSLEWAIIDPFDLYNGDERIIIQGPSEEDE